MKVSKRHLSQFNIKNYIEPAHTNTDKSPREMKSSGVCKFCRFGKCALFVLFVF